MEEARELLQAEGNDVQPQVADIGSLATILENDKSVRNKLLKNPPPQRYFTAWPDMRSIGVPSTKAMGMNKSVLELVATWWCGYYKSPRALDIETMRSEVGC